jgi:predicted MFS family arabinose efflux permease
MPSSMRVRAALAFALLTAGSILALAGTDLVLPAIPMLPDAIGGDRAQAQLVIAAFVAGTAFGMLAFGALTARWSRRTLLIGAAAAYALASLAAAFAPDMSSLIAIRFLQGAAGAAPAVFAAGVIRARFDEADATKAVGLLGSLESLAPALAPIVGVWLLSLGGWQASFFVTAAIAALLSLGFLAVGGVVPPAGPKPPGGYLRLLRSPVFLRYALSQAFILGGLLIFVFGAPVVITATLDGEIGHFIAMQGVGVAGFIAASMLTGFVVERLGAERMIFWGSALSAAAALAMLAYAFLGGREPLMLIALFAPLNIGLGLRGPPGFLRAVIAGAGDDDRASSLTILFILGVSAGGAALFAPFIEGGLPALAFASMLAEAVGMAALILLPQLKEQAPA